MDLRPDSGRKTATVKGTYDREVVVEWDDGTEEQVRAVDLKVRGAVSR